MRRHVSESPDAALDRTDDAARDPDARARASDASSETHHDAATLRLETPHDDAGAQRWRRGADWLVQHGALPVVGLVTVILIFAYASLFRGELGGDDITFHLAESARLADCLRAGDFDLWNPSGNAGFASAYYYQVVPQLASAIPTALFGHHLLFFQLSVFLPLVLAPAAAYRGMRLMGATPWQAAIAAVAIGMLNGESRWGTGSAGTLDVGIYTQTWALAAFPIALGHAVRWASQGAGLAPAVAWGTFVALCHPFAAVSLAAALVAGTAGQIALAGIDRWRESPPRPWAGELRRLAILGACMAVAWMPIWLPLAIDYDGFGGFPHRTDDEVGPGFATLLEWFARGDVFDHARPLVLTWLLPITAVFARSRLLRWLWAPAVLYALWLGLGPHIGKTQDDLIPAVRFLAPLQVVLALAIGAGAVTLVAKLWHADEGSPLARAARPAIALAGLGLLGFLAHALGTAARPTPVAIAQYLTLGRLSTEGARWWLIVWFVVVVGFGAVRAVPMWRALRTRHGLRVGIAAIAATLGVLLVGPGARALSARVHVLDDRKDRHPGDLHALAYLLQFQPPGRKQVGFGAENHWWNLLTYEYGRRPSLLMKGGGGVQASPNFDFLWTLNDFAKKAWLYDAPIAVFQTRHADRMPPGELILSTRYYTARRLPAPGLVSPVQITGTLPPGRKPAHAAALAWLASDEPLHDRVLAYDGSGRPGPAPHATITRAFRQDSPGDAADIHAEIDAAEPTTVMARESWHPRWRAYVDGAPAPVRRVTPDFPAVDVPAGHHVVSLRFERPWWAHASWLAWPLVPLLAWLITRRRAQSVAMSLQ